MDSLLVVLAVIGVILILAGVARMRSRRNHHRDEIDHSVLFDGTHNEGNELADDEFEIRRIHRVEEVREEPVIHMNEAQEREDDVASQSSVEDEIRISVDHSDRPEHLSEHLPKHIPKHIEEERPIARDPARSILNKLRLGGDEEEREPEGDSDLRHYRDNAPDKVIVLNIMAPRGQHFTGPALVDAIEGLGMVYGEMEIFHLYSDNAPLFSLVNTVKPGVFDMATIEEMTTPGVSLFIQLPNKQGNGLEAFDTMLELAQRLNTALGGSLCDERRSILTHSAIDYTRQQLAEYDCKWLTPA